MITQVLERVAKEAYSQGRISKATYERIRRELEEEEKKSPKLNKEQHERLIKRMFANIRGAAS